MSPYRPHPTNDPAGHSYGRRRRRTGPEETETETEPPRPPPLDPRAWRASADYLFGVDLWNHGYYWEAHEAWEGLWNAAGREGAVAELLKGLIKLAAAGVKVRQGRPAGVRTHCARAEAHLRRVRAETGAARFAGLDLDELAARAAACARDAEMLARRGDPERPVEVVFDWSLRLGD